MPRSGLKKDVWSQTFSTYNRSNYFTCWGSVIFFLLSSFRQSIELLAYLILTAWWKNAVLLPLIELTISRCLFHKGLLSSANTLIEFSYLKLQHQWLGCKIHSILFGSNSSSSLLTVMPSPTFLSNLPADNNDWCGKTTFDNWSVYLTSSLSYFHPNSSSFLFAIKQMYTWSTNMCSKLLLCHWIILHLCVLKLQVEVWNCHQEWCHYTNWQCYYGWTRS